MTAPGWLNLQVKFYREFHGSEREIEIDLNYIKVDRWQGNVTDCPSDADYYGYEEFDIINMFIDGSPTNCEPSHFDIDDSDILSAIKDKLDERAEP